MVLEELDVHDTDLDLIDKNKIQNFYQKWKTKREAYKKEEQKIQHLKSKVSLEKDMDFLAFSQQFQKTRLVEKEKKLQEAWNQKIQSLYEEWKKERVKYETEEKKKRGEKEEQEKKEKEQKKAQEKKENDKKEEKKKEKESPAPKEKEEETPKEKENLEKKGKKGKEEKTVSKKKEVKKEGEGEEKEKEDKGAEAVKEKTDQKKRKKEKDPSPEPLRPSPTVDEKKEKEKEVKNREEQEKMRISEEKDKKEKSLPLRKKEEKSQEKSEKKENLEGISPQWYDYLKHLPADKKKIAFSRLQQLKNDKDIAFGRIFEALRPYFKGLMAEICVAVEEKDFPQILKQMQHVSANAYDFSGMAQWVGRFYKAAGGEALKNKISPFFADYDPRWEGEKEKKNVSQEEKKDEDIEGKEETEETEEISHEEQEPGKEAEAREVGEEEKEVSEEYEDDFEEISKKEQEPEKEGEEEKEFLEKEDSQGFDKEEERGEEEPLLDFETLEEDEEEPEEKAVSLQASPDSLETEEFLSMEEKEDESLEEEKGENLEDEISLQEDQEKEIDIEEKSLFEEEAEKSEKDGETDLPEETQEIKSLDEEKREGTLKEDAERVDNGNNNENDEQIIYTKKEKIEEEEKENFSEEKEEEVSPEILEEAVQILNQQEKDFEKSLEEGKREEINEAVESLEFFLGEEKEGGLPSLERSDVEVSPELSQEIQDYREKIYNVERLKFRAQKNLGEKMKKVLDHPLYQTLFKIHSRCFHLMSDEQFHFFMTLYQEMYFPSDRSLMKVSTLVVLVQKYMGLMGGAEVKVLAPSSDHYVLTLEAKKVFIKIVQQVQKNPDIEKVVCVFKATECEWQLRKKGHLFQKYFLDYAREEVY